MSGQLTRRALVGTAFAGAVGYLMTRDSAVCRLCSRPEATPRRADSVLSEPRGDGLVLRADSDPLAAEFRLNAAGALVWLYADGGHSFGEISSRVASYWGIPKTRASLDTARFLSDLRRQGLISVS